MIFLLALLALSLLPILVQAQISEPPIFSVGDEWTYSGGLVRKVVKVDENGVVISGYGNCPTCLVYSNKNFSLIKVVTVRSSWEGANYDEEDEADAHPAPHHAHQRRRPTRHRSGARSCEAAGSAQRARRRSPGKTRAQPAR